MPWEYIFGNNRKETSSYEKFVRYEFLNLVTFKN